LLPIAATWLESGTGDDADDDDDANDDDDVM